MSKPRGIIVLDRSGSMSAIKDDMEGGLNALVADLEGDVRHWTLVKFDHHIETPFRKRPGAPEIRLNPRGSTALLDGLGTALQVFKNLDRPTTVIVVTDGQENASQEFTLEAIKKLIAEREEAGWQFVFLGANQDAFTTAGGLNMNSATSVTYGMTPQSVGAAIAHTASAVRSYGASGQSIQTHYDVTEVEDGGTK